MQLVEVKGSLRGKKEFAQFLQEVSQNAYFAYEFEDMLEILWFGLEQALVQGKEVRFGNICTFGSTVHEGKWTNLGTDKEPWYVPKHRKLRVKIHGPFRKYARKVSVEEFNDNQGEKNAE